MKTFNAPAKLNLNLRILKRRSDGFHQVETTMARVSIGDTLTFRRADALILKCTYPKVPLDSSNLVVKAVKLLEQHTGQRFCYEIEIDKRIPLGAGLAGGSSNAATTMRALNTIENLNLSVQELAALGGTLGADVAFFMYDQPCICRGRGELIEPVDLELDHKLVLFKPHFGVDTASAYAAWQCSKELVGIDYRPQTASWGGMFNDLERPVFEKHRFLAELKMWLLGRSETKGVMMSGSGSTMFAIVAGDASGLMAAAQREVDASLLCREVNFL